MVRRFGKGDTKNIPEILSTTPNVEFDLHQDFLFRHIDFLIDVLTAEHYESGYQLVSGCPHATPELQCRKKSTDSSHPCRYESLPEIEQDGVCACGDVLAGSDDPLDTVAAVAIAQPNKPPAQRYFDTEYRQIIASLRENVGSWDEVAALNNHQLSTELENATDRPSISNKRVTRLQDLLNCVDRCEKTEGTSLAGLGGISYDHFADLLEGFPGISRSDAWWILLVAFDKPVWPTGSLIDGILCSLGLLHQTDLDDNNERHEYLEDELITRQIPQLHRALAGHAVKAGINVCGETCESRKFFLSHRLREQKYQNNDQPVVVDLFSGAGGLSLGFDRAGWNIELAVDNNQKATDTYRLNHPEVQHRKVVCGDIREEIDNGIIEKIDADPDVVVGGPPCQSLSLVGYRSRLADDDDYSILDDERTDLYQEYVEIVESIRPKAIVMENVEGMVREIEDTGIKIGDLIIDELSSIGNDNQGYVCDYELIDAVEAGVPQHRERVIILGIREDLLHRHHYTVIDELFTELYESFSDAEFNLQQALSKIPKLRRGEGGTVVPNRVRGLPSQYVNLHNLTEGTNLCFNHQAREHPMEKDRTLFDEALEPGDTGWDVKYAKDGKYADLIEYDVGTEENPRFKDKYRMLKWDEPSPTVVAHLAKDANNFVIPDFYEYASQANGKTDSRRNRGITPREAARLQSFPDNYIFLGPFTSWFRQIGNAVPPLLGEYIANTLKDHLHLTASSNSMSNQTALNCMSTDD